MTWRDAFAALAEEHPSEIGAPARALADTIARLFPELRPAAKPGWRAVTFHHPRAGYVCGVFLGKSMASLVFENGCEMADPENLFVGNTRKVRQIPVRKGRQIVDAVLALYIAEAISLRS